jgi:hypothetical protein
MSQDFFTDDRRQHMRLQSASFAAMKGVLVVK